MFSARTALLLVLVVAMSSGSAFAETDALESLMRTLKPERRYYDENPPIGVPKLEQLNEAYNYLDTVDAEGLSRIFDKEPSKGCVAMILEGLPKPFKPESVHRFWFLYRLFKQNCENGQIYNIPPNLVTTETLNNTTNALVIGTKEPVPLTIELLKQAENEYLRFQSVFAVGEVSNFYRQDLTEAIIYLNLWQAKTLNRRFFPINSNSTLTDSQIANMKASFTKSMFSLGWDMKDGQLVQTTPKPRGNPGRIGYKFLNYGDNLYNLVNYESVTLNETRRK